MTPNRKANVVGGGIAGLAVAASLARRHWDVTLHERSSELREIGAGIYLKENSLRVLEEIGCIDAILQHTQRVNHTFINDRPGHFLRKASYGPQRVFTILREDLHRELANAAIALGVKVVFDSQVIGVSPEGRIRTRTSDEKVDLIIGADGIGSVVRQQCGLEASVGSTGGGSTRLLVPRHEGDTVDTSGEYWRGHRRVLVAPMLKGCIYLCASSRDDDLRGRAMPFDVAYWNEAFPELAHLFARVEPGAGVYHPHGLVRVKGWQAGRVALVGDSVHGQPPNLGQGAGMGIYNGQALAATLDTEPDIERALQVWEDGYMKFTRQVQNWSAGWEHVMHGWPLPLERLRSVAVMALATLPPTKQHWRNMYRGERP